MYPINLGVTFMHEFGHAFFAFITGGSVLELQVNTDGSGLATTSGGFRSLVLMGGYIGSAIFGNILLRIGIQNNHKLSEKILYFLSALMIGVGVIWFSSMSSFFILLALSGILIILAKYTTHDTLVLQFLGVASILFIIEDFNVGPTSDLSKFSEIFIIIPQFVWMIVWLVMVLVITWFNVRNILLKK
ncbi:M50 family metallopeptidase [Candidatus Gracilibacteria bacterium]|nr:M50 family metallopeptidase [Candidatus Gracilibacteria bacterium]